MPLGQREKELQTSDGSLPKAETQPLLLQPLQPQSLQLQPAAEPCPRGVQVAPREESHSSSTPKAESKAGSYDEDEFEEDFEDDFESEDDELEESG